MYSKGNSTRVRVLTYTREGKIILTNEIKWKLFGQILNLSAIEEDLNNGSGFSFPTPNKWRLYTGTSVTSNSGQISILLGGYNHKFFPSEEERDNDGVALFRSKILQNFLIYGPVNPCTIICTDPINTNTFNNICVNALSIHDL